MDDDTKNIIKLGLVILIIFIMAALGIWYAVWQYNLCYPEVSSSVWYCLQHAGLLGE
jgi:hypothetical protein